MKQLYKAFIAFSIDPVSQYNHFTWLSITPINAAFHRTMAATQAERRCYRSKESVLFVRRRWMMRLCWRLVMWVSPLWMSTHYSTLRGAHYKTSLTNISYCSSFADTNFWKILSSVLLYPPLMCWYCIGFLLLFCKLFFCYEQVQAQHCHILKLFSEFIATTRSCGCGGNNF